MEAEYPFRLPPRPDGVIFRRELPKVNRPIVHLDFGHPPPASPAEVNACRARCVVPAPLLILAIRQGRCFAKVPDHISGFDALNVIYLRRVKSMNNGEDRAVRQNIDAEHGAALISIFPNCG